MPARSRETAVARPPREEAAVTTDVLRRSRPDVAVTEHPATKQYTAEPRLRTAAEVMSRFPATVHMNSSLFSAWGKVHGGQNRHLVVIDDGLRPLGVLDERDIALEW